MRGDFEEDEIEDELETEFPDCHMDRHGHCGKAGSEECEFECEVRARQRAALETR